eukprot:10442961-Ditylum_brightwellii.AAC.2
MNAAIHSHQFTAIEIKQINNCRLYLGITMVSDITLADGCTLDPHMKAGNESLISSSSKQLQSKQARQNRTSWKLWGKNLKLFAQYDHLKVPLTQWLVDTPQLQRNWPMYIVPAT